jgi:hypothetical protein
MQVDAGGTATGGGVDYTLRTGTITILPGRTSADLRLTVLDDANDEPDETVTVTLSNARGATLGSIPSHTYTIVDEGRLPASLW